MGGLLFCVQLNPNVNAFHRNFVNEVKRCDEMERKLRFFEEQVVKEKGLSRILNSVSLENAGSNSASINIDELEVCFSCVFYTRQNLTPTQGRFDELEKELITLNNNQQMLDRSSNELVELRHVLSADSVFFAQVYIPSLLN